MTAARRIVEVFVIMPPAVLLLDVAGPIEVLRKANLVQDAMAFEVAYVGPAPAITGSVGLGLAGIAPLPQTLPDGALVIVPGTVEAPLGAFARDRAGEARQEAAITAWLARCIRPGIRLATICSGALLAARAGLLDGYACTTHHLSFPELTRVAPLADLRENRLYVDDRDRLSSAGVTAGIDMMLHVVAREIGHANALAVARYLVVYMRRTDADPQLSPWLEGRNHIHPAIHNAQDAIAADPARDWSVTALARLAGTSPRNLSRLFGEHVGMSVTDYVNRLRVALARELLAGSRLDMEAIAERAGFASARQFRRAWNRLNEASPRHSRAARPHRSA